MIFTGPLNFKKTRPVLLSTGNSEYTWTWIQRLKQLLLSHSSESPLDMDSHIIEDRSAEASAKSEAPSLPAAVSETRDRRREVGRRTRGYGLGRSCWCRRKRRSGRRRANLMGNMVCLSFAAGLLFSIHQ